MSSPTSSRICRASRSRSSATSSGPAPARSPSPRTARRRKPSSRAATPASRHGAPSQASRTFDAAVAELGLPIVLKTRRYGYDGKGQAWVRDAGEAEAAWEAIGEEPAVAEAGVAFAAEFSVIVARWADGRHGFWDSAENEHRRRHPAPLDRARAATRSRSQVEEAREAALRIAEALDHVGVLTVEFFASEDGPVVNEIAPRVHNSGHWTIEGAVTSQFEQHIRAICDLPPGSTELIGGGAVMDNLIGARRRPLGRAVAEPSAHVHLYGKGEARPGRKMGHVTRLVD